MNASLLLFIFIRSVFAAPRLRDSKAVGDDAVEG